MNHEQIVRRAVRAIPDFPKPGILFRDITPVLEEPAAFGAALAGLQEGLAGFGWNKLAAIESRGFLFGGPLAVRHQRPLVLMRKAGKLPGATRRVTYALEYGEAALEVHTTSLGPGDEVVIIDDLLATGGTAAAAAELITQAGATVAGFLFLVELKELGGRAVLEPLGRVFSLVQY